MDKQRMTLRSVVIGGIGCIILTAVSLYTALKLGALPWPIVFAAIIALLFLRLCGSRDLHEANISHTMMTAGSMVAGGLAFTVPGILILGAGEVSLGQLLLVTFAGTLLGLAATLVFRKKYLEQEPLEYPIGEAAAQTLIAGDNGGKTAATVFIPMGIAAIYGYLRDKLALLPQLFFTKVKVPGITFGVYNAPMMVAVGFLMGGIPMLFWLAGALIGDFGLVVGGSAAGWWDAATGSGIKSSLGMGLMIGGGVAVIVKTLLAPKKKTAGTVATDASEQSGIHPRQKTALVLVLTVAAFVLCLVLKLGAVASMVIVVLVWVTSIMAIISVGHTGIDPMEVFGLMVMLAAAALGNIPQMQMFFVAAVIAISCGLVGDVMNDYHAGKVLGTEPRLQFIAQAAGSFIGAAVAALTMYLLLRAYGADSFGVGKFFMATQATAVAQLVGGIPNIPAFIAGLALGLGLFFVGVPTVMLGLGVYLPFYLSVTAFIGGAIRLITDAVARKRTPEQAARMGVDGTLICSGVLGGESIAGVLIAFFSLAGL